MTGFDHEVTQAISFISATLGVEYDTGTDTSVRWSTGPTMNDLVASVEWGDGIAVIVNIDGGLPPALITRLYTIMGWAAYHAIDYQYR